MLLCCLANTYWEHGDPCGCIITSDNHDCHWACCCTCFVSNLNHLSDMPCYFWVLCSMAVPNPDHIDLHLQLCLQSGHVTWPMHMQETFDVSGLRLWWLRWMLPSRARRQGDGIFFPTVYNQPAVQYKQQNLHKKQPSVEVLVQHDWEALWVTGRVYNLQSCCCTVCVL